METVLLPAEKRNKGVSVANLRANRKIPAVLYGHGRENVLLQLDYQTFRKVHAEAGGSTIIDLDFGEKEKEKVLVYDVQYDPVTDEFIHVDFKYVRMDQAITTKIPLEFVGTAPAVREMDGVLDARKTEIEVKCLPSDLVSSIEVDISSLVDFNVVIHIKDLNIPRKIEVLHDPEEGVVTVLPPRVEEEEEEVPEEGEEKEEREEVAEGGELPESEGAKGGEKGQKPDEEEKVGERKKE